MGALIDKLRDKPFWQLFAAMPRASRPLTIAWWALIIARGVVPAVFGVAVGLMVSAVHDGDSLTAPLILLACSFIVMQVQVPVLNQVGENLGDRMSMWLHDRLLRSATGPAGVAHLESHEVVEDLAMARDFDLGMSGPPLSMSLGIIAGGLVLMATGIAQAALLFGYHWWAALLVGGAWAATHFLLRESTVWDRTEGEVRVAQRHAEYTYRLAVDAPAAKEIRIFNLADWVVARFATSRRRLVNARLHQTRLRHSPLRWAIAILILANAITFWALAHDAIAGRLSPAQVVIFAQAAIGSSLIAFGGMNWALPIAADAVASVLRLDGRMSTVGQLPSGGADAGGAPVTGIRFNQVNFSYPGQNAPVLDGFDLFVSAGTSLAVVGLNGEGKTTLIKLLCRLYDPASGGIEVDGQDIRTLNIESWRSRITAVFQDFARYELSMRENVAPHGAPDEVIKAALAEAGAGDLRDLDAILARGYDNGTELSGGQWQRVALARALCAVTMGAGVVILDEPTAQLDVRAEAAFFDQFLAASRGTTTILISHRFSTVRHADRICVLDKGRVAELGSHDELMALNGRYREMFDLQASRYDVEETSV